MGTLKAGGYLGVILLMALESSIVPIPSELVIPPAAYWASKGEMGMSMPGVILAGTFGCWLGSAIMYALSIAVGRPVLMRYGKFFGFGPDKLQMAENWVRDYGTAGVFFARLLPVIRHLISIPAGLTGMNFLRFSAVTLLGSFLWCSVLAYFGPHLINEEMFKDPDAMAAAMKHKTHVVAALVALVAVLYGVMKLLTRKKPAPSA